MGKSGGRITNEIRTLRFHRGEMTQQELADRIGVTRQTVNAIEGNKYSPSLEVAFRIARVFDVSLERVFRYSEPENSGKQRASAEDQAAGPIPLGTRPSARTE